MSKNRSILLNNLIKPAPCITRKNKSFTLRNFSKNNLLLSDNRNTNSELDSSSPINLDVSHEELAAEFLDRNSDLIARQGKIMDKIIKNSEKALNQELSSMLTDTDKLNKEEKIKLQENFNEMADIEHKNSSEDLNRAMLTRDDVLSLNSGRRRNSLGSDYSSSYESQTSINEFNNIDLNDSSYAARLTAVVDSAKKTLSNLISEQEINTSPCSEKTSNEVFVAESSNKRKLDSVESFDTSKRFKQDSSDVEKTDFDVSDYQDD